MATGYRRQQRHDPDTKHEYRQPVSYRSHPGTSDVRQDGHAQSSVILPDPYAEFVTTASTVHARIRAAALQNTSLLIALNDTEDAPSALAVKKVLVERTEDELDKQEQALRELERMIKDLRDKRDGSNNTLRDLLRRASAIIARLRKGHRENTEDASAQDHRNVGEQRSKEQMYFDTVALKSKEDKRKAELQHQLIAVRKEAKELEPQAEKHGGAHAELDALYESIFAGPTPGFPEEDATEREFELARENFENAKSKVLAKRKGVRTIEQAQRSLKQASVHATHAVTEVENAPFLALSDVKNELLNLDHYVTITNVTLEKSILALAPISAQLHGLAQELQTRLRKATISPTAKFEKAVLQEMLESTKQLLETSTALLNDMQTAAKREEEAARNDVRGEAQRLDEKRSKLQQLRQEAFEKVAGYGAAPPAYHNCCSRADQYEGECDLVVESSPVDEDHELYAPETHSELAV
ncbi:hypothetical protein BDV96DRAFT_648007 [Lophiotrema nucula]|uniref:Uncharacterized protein n=1 Tax=Lophiotrema nucula TaxID=690887 RepID=A0A6A5Z429_9PLEO|nr:hypothetical protein BDV96DRAFT_648007 [Lophiotrema nucula]